MSKALFSIYRDLLTLGNIQRVILLHIKCFLWYFMTFLLIVSLIIGKIFVFLSTSATKTDMAWETDTGYKNKFFSICADAATEALSAAHALRMMSLRVCMPRLSHSHSHLILLWSAANTCMTAGWNHGWIQHGYNTRFLFSCMKIEEINTTTLALLSYSPYKRHTTYGCMHSVWKQSTQAHKAHCRLMFDEKLKWEFLSILYA